LDEIHSHFSLFGVSEFRKRILELGEAGCDVLGLNNVFDIKKELLRMGVKISKFFYLYEKSRNGRLL
jgi:hypothetical protein